MKQPSLDDLITLVRTISAGRDVDAEKIAGILFFVAMCEYNFEEIPTDSGSLDMTLAEMQIQEALAR